MKKSIILAAALCVLCFAGCFAESAFEEIPFGIPSDEVFLQEEDFFEEAFFGGEEPNAGLLEDAATDELPEDTSDDAEERTVVIVPDKDISQEDWARKTPKLTVSVPKGKGKVALSWTLDGQTKRTGLPGDVKFYVYEWLEDKGAWVQAAGPVNGFSVTLTNVAAGDHVYVVRLERVNKNKTENYGITSDKVPTPVPVLSDRWMNAPKVKGVQSGVNEVTLTWTVAEKADYYRIDRKIGKQYLPAGSTCELKWVDGNASASNAYRVIPVKAFGWGETEGKAAGISVNVIEYWKTKPKILSVVENTNGTYTIRWTTTLNLPKEIAENDGIKWDSEFPHAFYISDESGSYRFTKFEADFRAIVLGDGIFEYTTMDKETAKKKKQAYLGGGSTPSFTVQPAMYLGPTADEEYLGEKSDPFVYRRKLSEKDGDQNIRGTVEDGWLKVEWDVCEENDAYFTQTNVYIMRDDGFSGDSGQGKAFKYYFGGPYTNNSQKSCGDPALHKTHYTMKCNLEALGSKYGSFSWYLEASFNYKEDQAPKVIKVVKTKLESFTVYDPEKVAPQFNNPETMNLYGDQEVTVAWTGGSGRYLLEINTDGVITPKEITDTSLLLQLKAGTRTACRVKEENGPWSKQLFINVYQPIEIVKITDNLPKTGKPKTGRDYKFTVQIEGGSGRYNYQLWEKREYPYLDLYTGYAWIDESDETMRKKATLTTQFDAANNFVELRVIDKITGQILKEVIPVDLSDTVPAWYDEVSVSVGKVTMKNGVYTVPLSWPACKAGLKPTKYQIFENIDGDKILVKTVGGSAGGAKLTGVKAGDHSYTVLPICNFGDDVIDGFESDPVTVTIP